jgi:hypothetical protein
MRVSFPEHHETDEPHVEEPNQVRAVHQHRGVFVFPDGVVDLKLNMKQMQLMIVSLNDIPQQFIHPMPEKARPARERL